MKSIPARIQEALRQIGGTLRRVPRRFRETSRHQRRIALLFGIAGGLLCFLLFSPALFHSPWSLVLEDTNGELLGARIARDGQWRFPFRKQVPQKFARAIVLYEDKRFFHHPGVDPVALVRAIRQNVRGRQIKSGGSTLTMQVIRLSRPGKPRTVFRKTCEAIAALRLEATSSKNTILALYAAHAPFGGNVVGLEAASWRYFGRRPSDLSWAEVATLAVLPNQPAIIHPGRNRRHLERKRNALLHRLFINGEMDSTSYSLALSEPLLPRPKPLPRLAPHLLDRVCLENKKHKDAGEWRVRSTLRRDLQEQVTAIVSRHHRGLAGRGIQNAAVVVLEVNSGAALAYIGNVMGSSFQDTVQEGQVDIITAPRSTGSILKPLLYAAMLDQGQILPRSLIPDVPVSIGGYMPRNYDRTYEGAVPACMALARSLNVPAVKMVQQYGIPRFHKLLRDVGMITVHRSAEDYGISIILGGVEGTLWELTGIYAGIARTVNEFHDRRIANHNLGYSFFAPSYASDIRNKPQSRTPLSAAACWAALEAMQEVARPGEEGAWRDFGSSRRVAWKTGTSFGFRDGWAIGCTPHNAVGVWVGNATGEGKPGLIGIEVAAPILFETFDLLPGNEWFRRPELELRAIPVCRTSGYRPGPFCEKLDTAFAPAAGMESDPCPYHHIVHLDATRSYRVTDECEAVHSMRHVSWFVLPPTMETFYRQRHSDYVPLPPLRPGCETNAQQRAMGLTYPTSNAAIYVPREIDGSMGRAVLQATHRDAQATIHWHLDEGFLGSTSGIHEMAITPDPGAHHLVLVDGKGERLEKTIKVIPR